MLKRYERKPETIETIQLTDNVSQSQTIEILRQHNVEVLGWGFAKKHPTDAGFEVIDEGYWVDFYEHGRRKIQQNQWLVKYQDGKIRVRSNIDSDYVLVE